MGGRGHFCFGPICGVERFGKLRHRPFQFADGYQGSHQTAHHAIKKCIGT